MEAISLLIKKGVSEANIIFLNLISVSWKFQLTEFFRVSSMMRDCYLRCPLGKLRTCAPFLISGLCAGTSRSACSVQMLSSSKDRDLGDWNGVERTLPCYPWYGRVWWSIFWHRWRLDSKHYVRSNHYFNAHNFYFFWVQFLWSSRWCDGNGVAF